MAARHCSGCVLLLLASCAGPYTLAHPTPRAQMRPMATDRPDMTESALSVDPGHVQVEFDAVAYSHARSGSVHEHDLRSPTLNARIGLSRRSDFQIVLTPFAWQGLVEQRTRTSTAMGFGDFVLRLKINLRGNDEEGFAVGLLPFVLAPTATGGVGEGLWVAGLAVPASIALGDHVDLGMMTQLTIQRGTHRPAAVGLLGTVTLGIDTGTLLGVFVEVAQNLGFDDARTASFEVHGGVTVDVSPDVRLDLGVFQTVAGADPATLAFLGGTVRH